MTLRSLAAMTGSAIRCAGAEASRYRPTSATTPYRRLQHYYFDGIRTTRSTDTVVGLTSAGQEPSRCSAVKPRDKH